jgi:hypothetical protein
MTVSLASVTPIPGDASEEIKQWIMELAGEVGSEMDNAEREIITQIKVGADRSVGDVQLKLSLTITASSGSDRDESDAPRRRKR